MAETRARDLADLGGDATGLVTLDQLELAIPTGVVTPFAGSTAPSGWLMCAGQEVSRTTYSGLFTVLGTQFGAGDGSTTFLLPDMRGRTAVAPDNMGGVDAGRLDWSNSLGTSGGEQKRVLSKYNLPPHFHELPEPSGVGGTLSPNYSPISQAPSWNTSNAHYGYWTGNGAISNERGNVNEPAPVLRSEPFEITQPSLVLNYIIKH